MVIMSRGGYEMVDVWRERGLDWDWVDGGGVGFGVSDFGFGFWILGWLVSFNFGDDEMTEMEATTV